MTKQEVKSEIRATREEWTIAINKWGNVRHALGIGTRLLDDQYPLYFKLKENIKSLNGEPVLIVRAPNGHPLEGYPYKGMILNTKEIGGNYSLTVFFQTIEQETWDHERIESIQLYQVIPVRSGFVITEQQKKDMKFFNLLNIINAKKNESVINTERSLREHKESMMSMQRDVERYERKITELEEVLEKSKSNALTLEGMLDSFRELGKNKKVFNAFLKEDGKMIIETEMIYATSPKTQKADKRKKVGRLAFELTTNGIGNCKFVNLDYCYHSPEYPGSHYYLPNVKNMNVCYGDNGVLMDNLAREGSFYELVDFLILFFSLFPHDTGAPYIGHIKWLGGRVRELKSNPFEVSSNRKLWELYPGKQYKRSLEEKKALMFSELEDFVNNTTNRVAPVRNGLTWLQPNIAVPNLSAPGIPEGPDMQGDIVRYMNARETEQAIGLAHQTVTEGINLTERVINEYLTDIGVEPVLREAPDITPTDPDELTF